MSGPTTIAAPQTDRAALRSEIRTAVLTLCLLAALLAPIVSHAGEMLRGTGDLAIVVERADGKVMIVDTTANRALAEVGGLGDLSHASAVYSRDGRFAYVFGRDGGLSKVDLLTASLVARTVQAGNSIGGASSQDGRLGVTLLRSPRFPAGEGASHRFSLALLPHGGNPRAARVPEEAEALALPLADQGAFELGERAHYRQHQVRHRRVLAGEGQMLLKELDAYAALSLPFELAFGGVEVLRRVEEPGRPTR